MKRWLAATAIAVGSLALVSPGTSHAGGVTVASAICSTDGAVIIWNHIAQAQQDALNGDIRTIELRSVTTFESTPRTLAFTPIAFGQWRLEPFAGTGTVLVDVELFETITSAAGTVYTNTTVPRIAITCNAPAATTTTAAPTTLPAATSTTAAPTTAPGQTTTTAAATTTSTPLPTLPAPSTTAVADELPATGASTTPQALAGLALLLAGTGLAVGSRRRRAS